MCFWVISTFNFSAFYEQGVNQDPALTASCKGLINGRFMARWQRKAVVMETGMRLGSPKTGAGCRIFPSPPCLPRAPAGILVLLGLGVVVGEPGSACALACVCETVRPKVKELEPSLGLSS